MQRLALILLFMITGCASFFNPYKDEFACPKTYNGRCVSVKDAYDESIVELNNSGNKEELEEEDIETIYQDALYQRLTALLEEPITPVVSPPQVMRILFLPYKGEDNELFMLRYVYFFVDEPKWILGDYLRGDE